VVASVEARMGSSRLPGKVLADVNGVAALTRLFRRLEQCRELSGVVLATTTNPADDVLADWAESTGVAVYRGSEEDVLRRVVDAQRTLSADVVVEVTGDCVLLDPEVIDLGIRTYMANDADVVANVRVPSYPQGADVQVFSFALLEEVERTVNDPAVREHVSLFFYEHPERYRLMHLVAPMKWHRPALRLQLDYPEDLQFIRAVYERLEPEYGDHFGLDQIMKLLEEQPELARINAHCEEKPVR
jgi:spore coat polysaccharide biosynthesis protein SpsF